jgi:hypothetical protein
VRVGHDNVAFGDDAQHAYEIRCYIRDPDGYLIEVGQTTDPQGDWSAWLQSGPPA